MSGGWCHVKSDNGLIVMNGTGPNVDWMCLIPFHSFNSSHYNEPVLRFLNTNLHCPPCSGLNIRFAKEKPTNSRAWRVSTELENKTWLAFWGLRLTPVGHSLTLTPFFPFAPSRRCIRTVPRASVTWWTRRSLPRASPTRTTSTPCTATASPPSTRTRADSGTYIHHPAHWTMPFD